MIFNNNFITKDFLQFIILIYLSIGNFFAGYLIFYLKYPKTNRILASFLLNLIITISQLMFIFFENYKWLIITFVVLMYVVFYLIVFFKFKQKLSITCSLGILYVCLFILKTIFYNSYYNYYAFFIAEYVIISIIFFRLYSSWFNKSLPIKLILSFFVVFIVLTIYILNTFNEFQKTYYSQTTQKTENFYNRFSSSIEYLKTFLKSSLLIKGTRELIYKKDCLKGHFHFLKLSFLYKADKVYFLDKSGNTIIASDWKFYKKNYGFRPYFLFAINGKINYFIARGVTTDVAGLYFAFPVYNRTNEKIIGVLVFKYNLLKFLNIIEKHNIMIMHESGIVLFGPEEIENSCIYKSKSNQIIFAIKNHILGKHQLKNTNYKIVKEHFLCTTKKLNNNCRFLIKYPLIDSDYYIVGIYSLKPLYEYKNKLFLYSALILFFLSIVLFEFTKRI